MKRLILCILSAAAMAVLLSGCGFKLFKSAEDLYTRPQLPEDYQALEDTIKAVKSGLDLEDATPLSGSNPSTIQLLDLDNDGVEEAAAAFFRSTSADDPLPLKIYLFRMSGDGSYTIAYKLEGEGNSINSIAYEDLNGDDRKEVVVSWQLTTRANVLSVYNLRGKAEEVTELLHITYNESYVLADLDKDGYKELVVVQRDDTGETVSRADYYSAQNELLPLVSSANLSANVLDVLSVRTGVLAGQKTALFVTSECDGGQVTDILAYKDGALTNITLNQDSWISNDTLREYTEVSVTDINRDGILEVPVALALPHANPESTTTHRVIYWRQFNSLGESSVACITYHNVTDGWYLVLPNEWDGQIAVERDDRENYRGEWAEVFYHRDSETGNLTKFLTIYRLTGSNMEARATLGSRELLYSNKTVAYAVEFSRDGWDCGLTVEQLRDRFSLIVKEWSTQ